MCRSLTEGEQHKVATCIVERLESTNWKDRTGPGARGDMSRATWAGSEIQVTSPASPAGNPGTAASENISQIMSDQVCRKRLYSEADKSGGRLRTLGYAALSGRGIS
jgi:hypothetical protein